MTTLFHKFKSQDFEYRWQSLKPIVVSPSSSISNAVDNSRRNSDSGIDLDTFHHNQSGNGASGSKNVSYSQQHHHHYNHGQQQHHNSPIRRTMMQQPDESGSSPSSSRRYSNSSTADLFSTSSLSLKQKSPSLENLHGSLDNLSLNKRAIIIPPSPSYDGDGVALPSDDFSLWFKNNIDPAATTAMYDYDNKQAALDFHLGPMTDNDRSS